MKTIIRLFILFTLGFSTTWANAQVRTDDYVNDTTSIDYYKITKQDGNIITGRLKSMDAREVILITDNLGEVSIPKHEIKSMDKLMREDFNVDGTLKH
ncbi:MAG: hypothetical protein ACKOZY_11550, partial [Flavobacteriales bacterium]